MTGLEEEDELSSIIKQYDADRGVAMDEAQSYDLGGRTGAALSAIGAGFMGRDPGAAANAVLNRNQAAKDAKVSAIDKWKQGKIADIQARREGKASDMNLAKMQREADLSDPNSEKSLAFRKSIEANFPKIAQAYGPDWAKVSAADQEALFKPLQLKEQIEGRNQTAAILAGDRKAAREAAGEARKVKDAELSSTQAKQAGLYKQGALAEQQYAEAVSDKDKYDPTSVGQWIDNSEWAPNWMKNDKAVEAQGAQARWVEAYLRDASGAAIPPSERMAYAKDYFPQPGDTDTEKANKLQARNQKMENAKIGAGPSATLMADQSPARDPDAETYAKMHNLPYDKALAIITKRKGTKNVAGGM